MSIAAIIVAAGRGQRAGSPIPKQYLTIGGRSVLARTLDAFLSAPEVTAVQPVIHPEDGGAYDAATADVRDTGAARLRRPVAGGETRQVSVLRGLEALQAAGGAEIVLIHDAARPFVTHMVIGRAVEAARLHGAASPGVPVTDTIQAVDEAGAVTATPPRESLRAIQTPQAFRFDALLSAHRNAAAAGLESFSDDGAVAAWAGMPVTVFPGDPANVKLTTPADIDAAERRLGGGTDALVVRLGTGFDVHAFGDGDHIWLAGIRIAHARGVVAHSDGDVVLHALTDAVLGAIADGDIGTHFPPSDPQWRGAASDRFLAYAVERVRARGGVVDHLDATVLCEAPRVGPHREAMRARIAAIAGIAVDQVSIKATTTERLGFTGRGEGIAAQAAATIRVPAARPA
jgi:2-C-methyl-D-erythritol 4-phosphate cytidylyltransferase / 2-C-methyl-D-erythritol 2,4-cyclodiphosphate synthase